MSVNRDNATPGTRGDRRPFAGNERFRVVQRLGAGGMGEVYEVEDLVRRQRVALKQLTGLDPLHLQLFKEEFRGLADIRHPQLVRMHELFNEGGDWFFTMDLVSGQPLFGRGSCASRSDRLKRSLGYEPCS